MRASLEALGSRNGAAVFEATRAKTPRGRKTKLKPLKFHDLWKFFGDSSVEHQGLSDDFGLPNGIFWRSRSFRTLFSSLSREGT
jgi:hypothetical protein